MSSQSKSAETPSTGDLAPLLPMIWRQTRVELLRLWRTPSFFVPTLLLPIVLYTLLGGLGKGSSLQDGVSRQTYALASIGTYGIIGVMLYSFGVSMANERAQRVNVLMRATPLPATIYLLAKVVTALLSAAVMVIALSIFATLVGGLHLSLSAWGTLVVSLVLGAIPFLLLGIAIGNVVNPTGATPIINLSFFALAFASGIFVPVSQLPDVLQTIAPYSPFYLLGQLAWHAVGVNVGSIATAPWLLALYGLFFLILAIAAARAEEVRSFG